jgi:hypothetical protein
VLETFRILSRVVGAKPVADVQWIPTYRQLAPDRGWPIQGDSSLRTRRAELVTAHKLGEAGTVYIGKRKHTLWRLV